MGEIAEMMLDGTLDIETGEYLGEGPGYPRTAESFARDPLAYAYDEKQRKQPNGKMGKATRRLFAEMYRADCTNGKNGHGLEVIEPVSAQHYALRNRGYIEKSSNGRNWVLTKSGREKAIELFC